MSVGSNQVAQVVLEIVVPTAGALPIAISCDSPPSGVQGVPYSHLFPVTGDVPPDVFTITAGALPTGLSLDFATGTVSGVPTAIGAFPFTVTVTDSTAASASVPCSITIAPAVALGISCNTPPTGFVFTFYSHVFPVSGDVPPDVFTIMAGALPTGLSLGIHTGEVFGIPILAGIYSFTIQVTDSTSATAQIACSITISSGVPPSPPFPSGAAIKITFRGVKRTRCEPVEPLAVLPPVPHVKRAM